MSHLGRDDQALRLLILSHNQVVLLVFDVRPDGTWQVEERPKALQDALDRADPLRLSLHAKTANPSSTSQCVPDLSLSILKRPEGWVLRACTNVRTTSCPSMITPRGATWADLTWHYTGDQSQANFAQTCMQCNCPCGFAANPSAVATKLKWGLHGRSSVGLSLLTKCPP